ncbi:gfo/Idh/MocA family oxidoreductase [Mycolicibacterium sp. P9-64]|uniref:Gfo/Idh/MocA family protein n=1 Tax=Mycolicibacterium sp. P9-64 TaxID=2024612 RepID=UPI0011EC5CE8|nr:Gfo/Idh/MocA family oxidoreductase [Mycolicibacterium sp. P9-64]KAA0086531.1 gfo/Idh/MocA family oxidoreductase [Mycolicibacterium sp. P9-64]
MSDRAPLNWGLIGASDIAQTLMIPALRRMNQDILGLASNSADHAAEFAVRNEMPSQKADFSLDRLLEDPSIDAVYISSTNEHHLAHAEAAAAAGKHVLCEKPLSVDLDAARRITAACAAHGVVLGVNHHLPAAGTHRTVRELVRDGAIGRVLSVNVRHTSLLPERLRGWRLSDRPGAGVVMDLSCHDASVVNPLLGTKALEAVAITVRQGRWETAGEDASAAVIRYEDDVLVRFHDAFTTPQTPTYLEVHGDEGSIVAPDVMTPEPIGTVLLRTARGEAEVDVPDRRHTYDITIEHFVNAVAGDGRPVVDGRDAVNALAVCESILESARTGTRVAVDFQ